MVIVDSFNNHGVEEIFNLAINNIDWSYGLSEELKKYLVLYQLGDGLRSVAFYCTQLFNLSRNQREFNRFCRELETNDSLEECKGYIRDVFGKYLDSLVIQEMGIPDPPRLRRTIELRFERCNNGDYKLCRNGKTLSYNMAVPIRELTQLSVDF